MFLKHQSPRNDLSIICWKQNKGGDKMRSLLLKSSFVIAIFAQILVFDSRAVFAWFATGQDADIMLSGIDFNNTGGALLFNHPMNITTDGTRLLLADTRNNRILIWNSLPGGNVAPDLVLGQANFTTNNPGTDMSGLNWPVGVATAGGKVVVADTYNDRILIWNTFPTSNAQAADLSIEFNNPADPKENVEWPWDVWTDGKKLIVTSTGSVPSTVLIWNTFPTANNQKADLYLKGKSPDDGTDRFGTPRTIGTDGETYLVIGDHNAVGQSTDVGSFFWNSFPTTDNQQYDFFMANPEDPNQMMWGGVMTSDGKFITVASPGIAIWNSVPMSVSDPDLFVGKSSGTCDETGYYFNNGDGCDLVVTSSGKLYVSLYNSNKVVAFNSVPTSSTKCPDFAIGAPDIDTNTLDTNYIITNGMPATNGSNLFVSSDFDSKLYVWKSIPSQNGTHPDTVYELDFQPWDNALYGNTFVIGGKQTIQIWTTLPITGNPADITFDGGIGAVSFQRIVGIALDDKYLYVADNTAGKLYVWDALPDASSSPLFSLDISGIGRIFSDGTYLSVIPSEQKVQIYSVDGLSSSSSPVAEIPASGASYTLNLPGNTLIAEDHFFIADTSFNRVLGWESIEGAINGNDPDVVLGQEDFSMSNTEPAIGKDRLFMPVGLAFYTDRLWVGEFKFSGRLVGFEYPDLPTVTTNSATSVSSDSATLNGTVNPNGVSTTYYFEYGTTTSYGTSTTSTSAGSGTSAVSVNAAISDLTSDTTYHYRLVATNSSGTSNGDDKTFSTTIIYVESTGLCGGNIPCYTTIQEAIDAVSSGAIIKIAEEVYDEGLIIDTANDLILQGGWDSTFTSQSSNTTVNFLTISNGSIEVDKVILQ